METHFIPMCAVIIGCVVRENGPVDSSRKYIEETAEASKEIPPKFSGHKDNLSETNLQANVSKEYIFCRAWKESLTGRMVTGFRQMPEVLEETKKRDRTIY